MEPTVAAVLEGQQITNNTTATSTSVTSMEFSPQHGSRLAHVPSAQQNLPLGHGPPLSHPGVKNKPRAGNVSGHCDTLNVTVINLMNFHTCRACTSVCHISTLNPKLTLLRIEHASTSQLVGLDFLCRLCRTMEHLVAAPTATPIRNDLIPRPVAVGAQVLFPQHSYWEGQSPSSSQAEKVGRRNQADNRIMCTYITAHFVSYTRMKSGHDA